MKPYHSVLLFLLLLAGGLASGRYGYNCAKDYLVADMNQALWRTLLQKHEAALTPDTLTVYRRHLKTAALRQTSVIYYAAAGQVGTLRSRTMKWRDERGQCVAFRGYANCSAATIFALSNQGPAAALSLAALAWAAFSLVYFRRNRRGAIVVGGLMLLRADGRFLTLKREPVALTPMQQQLLQMFFAAPDHRLAKQQICAALWPRKPDASETLYTLIRRTRPVLAARGLTITTARGYDYRLTAL